MKRVFLEHYQFDDIGGGCSPVYGEEFDCDDTQLLAMQLIANGRKQLDSYQSEPDYEKTVAWLTGKEDAYAFAMFDEVGDPVDPKEFILNLRDVYELEAFHEELYRHVHNKFVVYDNLDGDHPKYQLGGVIDVKVRK